MTISLNIATLSSHIGSLRGGIKKSSFFSQKNSEILRTPPSSNSEAPVFSDKEISELARPPPLFGEKFQNILIFFDEIPMDWVKTPLLAKISQNPHF